MIYNRIEIKEQKERIIERVTYLPLNQHLSIPNLGLMKESGTKGAVSMKSDTAKIRRGPPQAYREYRINFLCSLSFTDPRKGFKPLYHQQNIALQKQNPNKNLSLIIVRNSKSNNYSRLQQFQSIKLFPWMKKFTKNIIIFTKFNDKIINTIQYVSLKLSIRRGSSS